MDRSKISTILKTLPTDLICNKDTIDAGLFEQFQANPKWIPICFSDFDLDSAKYNTIRSCSYCNSDINLGYLTYTKFLASINQIEYLCNSCRLMRDKLRRDKLVNIFDKYCAPEARRDYEELKKDASKLKNLWITLSEADKKLFAEKLCELDYTSQFLNSVYWKCVCELKFQDANGICERRYCDYCKNLRKPKKSDFEFHHPKHQYSKIRGYELDYLDEIQMLCKEAHRDQHPEFGPPIIIK